MSIQKTTDGSFNPVGKANELVRRIPTDDETKIQVLEPKPTETTNTSSEQKNTRFLNFNLVELIQNAQARNEVSSLENERMADFELEVRAASISVTSIEEIRATIEDLKKLFNIASTDFYEVLKGKYNSIDSLTAENDCALKAIYGIMLLTKNPDFKLEDFDYGELTRETLCEVLLPLNKEEKKIFIESLFLNPDLDTGDIKKLTNILFSFFPVEDGEEINIENIPKEGQAVLDTTKQYTEEVYTAVQETGKTLFKQVLDLFEIRENIMDEEPDWSSEEDDSGSTTFMDDEVQDERVVQKLVFEKNREEILLEGIGKALFDISIENIARIYEIALAESIREQAGHCLISHAENRSDHKYVSDIFYEDFTNVENEDRNKDQRKFNALVLYSILHGKKAIDILSQSLESKSLAVRYAAITQLANREITKNRGYRKVLERIQSDIANSKESFSLAMLITFSQIAPLFDKGTRHTYEPILKEAFSLAGIDMKKALLNLDRVEIPLISGNAEPMIDNPNEPDDTQRIITVNPTTKAFLSSIGITKLLKWSLNAENPNLSKNAQAALSLFDLEDIQKFLALNPHAEKLLTGAGLPIASKAT